MTEQEALAAIERGVSAYELLSDNAPDIERRWKRMTKTMRDLINDTKQVFPDAQYYTASGGFNLLLGSPHDESRNMRSQQQLVALSSSGFTVGDGDF